MQILNHNQQRQQQEEADSQNSIQQPTIADYSKYLIEVICKFLESFKGICSFPEGVCRYSLRSFVRSILFQSKISYSIVATGLLYLLWSKQSMKRLANLKMAKQIGIFEMFVTALMLSSKYLNDRNASNSAWSRISGIPLETLNKMEMKLLSFIEYKLHVEVDLFDRWIKFIFQPVKTSNYFKVTGNLNVNIIANSNNKNNLTNNESIAIQHNKKIKMAIIASEILASMIIIKNITQFIFLTTATVQLTSIHGVSEKDLHVYKKDKLTCPSTGKQLSASMINDGVCDCPDDGFDEPGTAACQAGHFYCKNSHNLELIIDSFKVNDGVCDCCDGSDEYLNLFDKKCPNSCGQLRRDLRRTAYLDMVKIKKARVYYEKNKIEALIMREELKLNLDEITSKLKYAQPEEAKADNTDRPNIDQLDHLITNQRSTSEKTQSIWRHLIDTKLKRAKQFISLMATGSNTPMTENVKNNPSTIVTTADSSKNSYYEDSDEKDELMENMKDIENILNNPELYGPDSVFLPLKGRCFEAENAGFSYSLCWFDEIRQSNGNSIGIWNGKWRENGENRIDYTNMFYNDGNWCGSKARETQVSLKCGWSDQIVSVEEPSKCFYLIEFSTPIACIL